MFDVISALNNVHTSSRGHGIGEISLTYHKANANYNLEPHDDIRPKKFSIIVYLKNETNDESWGTSVYEFINQEITEVGRTKFKSNSAFIFAPQDGLTFHGVPYKPNRTSYRHSLLINYNYSESK